MAATFKISLNWRIPESWFLQLSKSGTIGIFLQKFDNYWKREMWFDLFAFCYLPVMLRPLHFLSQDCDISLWLNAHFLWNPVQSLPSGSSSPPSHSQSQFACEECWHLMWSFSPSLPSLFDGSHLSISSQFYFLLWIRPLPLASTTSFRLFLGTNFELRRKTTFTFLRGNIFFLWSKGVFQL